MKADRTGCAETLQLSDVFSRPSSTEAKCFCFFYPHRDKDDGGLKSRNGFFFFFFFFFFKGLM